MVEWVDTSLVDSFIHSLTHSVNYVAGTELSTEKMFLHETQSLSPGLYSLVSRWCGQGVEEMPINRDCSTVY